MTHPFGPSITWRIARHNCWCCGRFIWAANDWYSCPWDEVQWLRAVPYPNIVYHWDAIPDPVLGWVLPEKVTDVEGSPVV